jgi:hypothetical protein
MTPRLDRRYILSILRQTTRGEDLEAPTTTRSWVGTNYPGHSYGRSQVEPFSRRLAESRATMFKLRRRSLATAIAFDSHELRHLPKLAPRIPRVRFARP